MSKRKINLEEILGDPDVWECHMRRDGWSKDLVITAMKEACRRVLELAAENAELEERDYRKNPTKISNYGEEVCSEYEGIYYGVDKQSILSTINQVE